MFDLALELSPSICQRFGVECDGCVRSRAHTIARISPGWSPTEAAKLFHTLYPSSGCQPMQNLFLISYREQIEIALAQAGSGEEIRFVA